MLLLILALTQAPTVIEPWPGMVITQSVVVKPKTYRLSGKPIVIRGDNISIDFRGATLQGSDPLADPDQARDTAIVIEGGSNILIANAHIHGFKIGILARGTQRLSLLGNDVSANWKPRLFSVVEHESLVDWLSFHHNDKDEWLRFGAAIYLQDVKGGEVRQNLALGGMNALLAVRTTGLMIRDNNFSFNSGLGIGLYRSSDDTVVHNRLDYNVRGYSHGRYSRGQDSADLLLFEQSSRNVVAFNSLTHGGDGIFLWAGQTTMDSGTGGSNDNLFYGNDVSYATANGVEITFSRNKVIANRAWGSEYGVWGGYSYETEISGNDFRGNRTGVAIEHGQDNTIAGNRFDHDWTAIRLWADSIQPSDWGYPKHHDTRSRDYHIVDNEFIGNRTLLNVRNTVGLDTTSTILHQPPPPFITALADDSITVPSSELARRDRSAIIVDEWGPYAWQLPKLSPVGRDTSGGVVRYRFVALGPKLRVPWRLRASHGVAALRTTAGSAGAGLIGDTVVVTPSDQTDWMVRLTSHGMLFGYEVFEPKIDWRLDFFSWSDSAAAGQTPLILPEGAPTPGPSVRSPSRLDLMWYRPPQPFSFLPHDHWGIEARGVVDLVPGTYSVRTISDDAVRVWVDGVLAIDNWTPHESQVDYAPLPAGKHDLRVAYRQVDGWVELRADIMRGSSRSAGSPGPH
jgi:nitrous oxidase accessory protein NosD